MSDTAADLLSLLAGIQARDAALQQLVDAKATQDWLRAAACAIRWVAMGQQEFTTDDVWAELDWLAWPAPVEPRAMGAAMRAASDAGHCQPTDRTTQSHRPGCHARPVRVWRSTMYEENIND